MPKILTTPREERENPRVLYTGNHYICLPEISPVDAGVTSLNLITQVNKGLVQLGGAEYLLKPIFLTNGERLVPDKVESWLEAYYIPTFRFHFPGLKPFVLQIFPDRQEKGILFQVSGPKEVTAKFSFHPHSLQFLRFNSHPVEMQVKFGQDKWLGNPVMEIRGPQLAFALAFGAEADLIWDFQDGRLHLELPAENNALYVSVNSDPDGASTTLIHLRRKGHHQIYQELQQWLESKAQSIPDELELEQVLNQNLFFNYFFAVGKDLGTDNYLAMTSRSPRYYVSGAFWERDSFLWSFPAIKIIDPNLHRKLAKEMILRHYRNAGDHAHYIDGTVLYPGFELDQAASYFILLADLPAEDIDTALLNALQSVFNRIEQEYDPAAGLYRTFLLPSDDPAENPFVTINQAILLAGLTTLAGVLRENGLTGKAALVEKRMDSIRQGVRRHLVVEEDGLPIYAWSSDGQGKYRLYNDPPGNLGLLPFYRFTHSGDPIFQNTIDYYYSPKYQYHFCEAAIGELACDHHPQTPSGLGLCGSILNPLMQERALDWLKIAVMDHGLLAESFDRETGEARTGVGFATGSGYLAYALYSALIEGR